MGNQIEILVVGNHEKIMEILLRYINNDENWTATAAHTLDEAKEVFERKIFDIVLISSGFDDNTEQEMIRFFNEKNARTEVVLHFGGGTGLLFNEIHAAIERLNSK